MNQVLTGKKIENISLSELYEKFSADIFKYSFSILKNREEANDAVQEVFVKHALNENSFKHNCSEKTWLLIITRNYCYNRLKNKNYNQVDIESEFINKSIQQDFDLKLSIEDAMNRLTIEYSELIYLKDYEGYSYKEIVELTGLSLENVKIKLFRARQQLRKYLKREL